jgi:hypothetical protein
VATLDSLEAEFAALPFVADIGDVAIGCALAYADFRFADINWRIGRPRLTAFQASFDLRPSTTATAIVDDEAQPVVIR